MTCTVLFAEIANWAVRMGAKNVDQLGHPWTGETDEWKVTINCTGEEVDNTPHMAAKLEHKKYLSFGVVGPSGGAVMGASEDDLITHFKAA